jgi:lambda family phage portal protein
VAATTTRSTVLGRLWRGIRAAAFPTSPGRSPYKGAAGGRATRGIYAPSSGVNSTLASSLDTLRSRSRALMRSNPWAWNGLESFVANAIGTGLTPEPLFPDAGFAKAVKDLWRDWTDDADAAGLTDLNGLQALACRSMVEGGEVFARLRPRRLEDGLTVPLQVQLLEGEHCPTWKTETLGGGAGSIRMGVEFGPIGNRVAYHLYREHPGDGFLASPADLDLVRVPAEQIAHLFRPIRPGQLRGEPWAARVMLRLNDLDEYDQAELTRKKGASMIGGVVTCPDPDKLPEVMGEPQSDDPDSTGAMEIAMEPGTYMPLPPGWGIEQMDPADSGPNYDQFVAYALRGIGVGFCGLPYHKISGDYSRVNYTSSRSAELDFRRRVEADVHGVIAFQLMRPIWRAFMDAAVASRALVVADYAAKRSQYLRVEWVPQGWEWVDPEKEVNASIKAIRAGITSRRRIVAKQGGSSEQIDQEQHDDNARADGFANVAYDSDGRRPANGAAAAATDTTDTGEATDGTGTDAGDVTPPAQPKQRARGGQRG